MTELFREAAVKAVQGRLEGGVSLVTRPSGLILAVVGVSIVALCVLMASVVPIPITASLTGVLISQEGTPQLRAQHGGVVQEVFAMPGVLVTKGAPIVRIRLATDISPGSDATRAFKSNVDSEGAAINDETAAEISALEVTAIEARRTIMSKRRDLALMLEKIGLQTSRTELSQSALSDAELLLAKGFLSKLSLNNRREEVIEQKMALVEMRRAEGVLRLEIYKQEMIISTTIQSIALAKSRNEQEIARFNQRRLNSFTSGDYILSAPVSGRMGSLSLAVGEPVDEGQVIGTVVPPTQTLQARLLAGPNDAARLRVGQAVRLRLVGNTSAGGQRLSGRILRVDRVPTPASQSPGSPERVETPTYLVLATVRGSKRHPIDALGLVGAPIAARVTLGRRTIVRMLGTL